MTPQRPDAAPSEVVDAVRRTRLGTRLGLYFLFTLIGFVALEALCRWRMQRINQRPIETARALPFSQSSSEYATTREIIRPVTDDRMVFELRPSLEAVPYKGTLLSTNSHGFRSPEIPPEEPPGTVTIVGIGDSILMGHGVENGENYLDQLVGLLRQRRPQVEWRYLNTGMPGCNYVMKAASLEKALAFSPDLVIPGITGNDYDPPMYVRTARSANDLSRSYLVDFVRERISGDDPHAQKEALTFRKTWSEEAGAETPERYAHLYGEAAYETALDRLKALSEKHGFRVLAFATIDYPKAPEMMESHGRRGFARAHLQPDIERHYKETTGEEFSWEGYVASDLVVSRNNLHPSVLQHRMAAECILAQLEELGWIDALVESAH